MTILRFFTVFFLLFTTSISVFSDEAFDFYVETCRHSGYNPAEIETFQAMLMITQQITLPASQVDAKAKSLTDRLEKTLKKAMAGRADGDAEAQKTAAEMGKKYRQSFSGEAKTSSVKISMRNSAAPLGLEDVPAQVLKEDRDTKEVSLFSIGTKHLELPIGTYPTGMEGRMGMLQSEHTTLVGTDSYGGNECYLGGRTQTVTTINALNMLLSRDASGRFVVSERGIAALKKKCEIGKRTFSLLEEKVKYEKNYSAQILEIYEKGQLCGRLWIDSDRGYICPKEQTYNAVDGTSETEIISENFILDEHSQKWFPTKVTKTSWYGEREIISVFSVLPDTLVLNQPIPDSVFVLTLQKGMRVEDVRRKDNDEITFFANTTGKLDLPTVEKKSLDEIPWLSQREVARSYLQPIEKAYFSWIRITFMTAGIILIVLGLYLRFFEKK